MWRFRSSGIDVLDLGRRDRVEARAGLVEEDDLGLEGQGPGDAEALLLAARELLPGDAEPVLDLVPEVGGSKALLDDPSRAALPRDAGDPRPVGDVVVDADSGSGMGRAKIIPTLLAQILDRPISRSMSWPSSRIVPVFRIRGSGR